MVALICLIGLFGAIGVALLLALPIVAIRNREPAWVPFASVGFGLLMLGTAWGIAAALSQRMDRVTAGIFHWRGAQRPAVLIPMSRSGIAFGAFTAIAVLAACGFLAAVTTQSLPIAVLATLVVAALATPFVALTIGPQIIVIMPDGVLVRMGMVTRYVPWSAVTEVSIAPGYGEDDESSIELEVSDSGAIESGAFGRFFQVIGLFRGVRIRKSALRVPLDEARARLRNAWKDAQGTGISGAPAVDDDKSRSSSGDSHGPADARWPGARVATESSTISAAEAEQIVSEFERVRNTHRGQMAAPMSDLADTPERIAAAIHVAAPAARSKRKRQLAEALVDLAAFLPGEDAALVNEYAATSTGRRRTASVDATRARELTSAMDVDRARVIQHLRGDPSIVGNLNALRAPVRIGEARLALDQVADYREFQLAGMIGGVVMFAGTAVAFVLGETWWLVFVAGWAAAGLGTLVITPIPRALDRVVRSRISETFHARLDLVRELSIVVLVVGITITAMVLAVFWT